MTYEELHKQYESMKSENDQLRKLLNDCMYIETFASKNNFIGLDSGSYVKVLPNGKWVIEDENK